jgi:hypothetical protein
MAKAAIVPETNSIIRMFSRKILARSLIAVAAAGSLLALLAVSPWYGNWLFFDPLDLNVYFNSSRWIVEGGLLYREVPSEYPLLANVIFAIWRLLGNTVYPGIKGFQYAWVASTGLIYLWAVHRVATQTQLLAVLAWVAPASIFFAFSRYDIYPVVATLLALFAIRRASYIEGALWLGVAAALKGYALCLLPAFFVFMIYRRGFVAAVCAAALVVAPMIASLLATLAVAGWEGLAPFKYHMQRGFNGESIYDAMNVLGADLTFNRMPFVPKTLQLATALAAAAMLPRTFDALVNAFIFALLGFMTFSAFYSPQFVLWLLPFVSFADSRVMVISTIALSWLTYIEFPLSGHFDDIKALFYAPLVAASFIRLFMMLLSIAHSLEPWFPARRLFEKSGAS